jgi:hypothetical protein
MNKTLENWTKEEFLVYVMLYAATADTHITMQEQRTICEIAEEKTYNKMLNIFNEDTLMTCLQNVKDGSKKFFDSNIQVLDTIKEVFFIDSKFSGYEQHFLKTISRILK